MSQIVEAYYGLIKLPRWCRTAWMIPVWFVAAKVSYYYLGHVSLIFPLLGVVFYGMTFFTLVNFCIDAEATSSWAKHRLAVWLANVGLFSYSLYLVHYPVMMILREVFVVIAPPSNVWIALGEAVVKVVIAFYVAKLFFNLVERRFLNTSVGFRSIKTADRDDGEQTQAAYLTQPDK